MLKKFLGFLFALTLLTTGMLAVGNAKAEAYLGDSTLRYGQSGYDVQQLQQDLSYLGYGVGQPDGNFGWRTSQAVQNFQWKNGLQVDGVVGKQTALAIINQVSHGQASSGRSPETSRGSGGLSRADVYELAHVVYGEARGEPFEGQVAVAAVVLNRLYSGEFGANVHDIIFQPEAFTAVSDGQYWLNPGQTALNAVMSAINGWDPTGGALYYYNPVTATSSWIFNLPVIKKIGHHLFAS